MASTETAPETVRRAGGPHAVGFAAAPYPVLVLAADGTPLEASPSARRLLGTGSPADAVPWLLDAHRAVVARERRTDVASGAVSGAGGAGGGVTAGQELEAHPSVRPDGSVVWWLVEAGDRALADRELRLEHDRSALLAEVSGALLSTLNPDRCLELTARQAAAHLADAAVVVAPGGGRRVRFVSCVRGGEPVHERVVADPAEVPGLAEALQGFPPVPSRWIDPASCPEWLIPASFGGTAGGGGQADGSGASGVGAVAVIPLPGHGVPAGALVLLRGAGQGAFSESEEVFARLFAGRAGAAVSAAVMYADQTAVTSLLMRELLPPRLEHLAGVDFAGGYRAAEERERIGGDFYDVHPAAEPGEETLAVLGDVCGKGLEAAVLTGKIRNTLHALLPLAGDHERLLNLLNRALLTSHHTRFATLVLASVRREADAVRLRLSAAGHPAPFVVRADGRVEAAETAGTIVGVMPRVTTVTAEVRLAPGEACVLFSDGVTEARGGPLGGEMFGEERLRDALAECAGLPAEAIAERVQMLAAQWVGSRRHDDMAVLVVAAPRGARLSVVGRPERRVGGRVTGHGAGGRGVGR